MKKDELSRQTLADFNSLMGVISPGHVMTDEERMALLLLQQAFSETTSTRSVAVGLLVDPTSDPHVQNVSMFRFVTAAYMAHLARIIVHCVDQDDWPKWVMALHQALADHNKTCPVGSNTQLKGVGWGK